MGKFSRMKQEECACSIKKIVFLNVSLKTRGKGCQTETPEIRSFLGN